VTTRSYGDGRHMSVAEAVERRTRMIRFHGSLEAAVEHGTANAEPSGDMSRFWTSWVCLNPDDSEDCTHDASNPEDCAKPLDYVVAVCPVCRGAA
jgi:hypothetical protein